MLGRYRNWAENIAGPIWAYPDQIKTLSRESMKTIITCRIKTICFEYLISKAKAHSKVKSDIYSDINGCKYFHDKRFQPELSQLVFKTKLNLTFEINIKKI